MTGQEFRAARRQLGLSLNGIADLFRVHQTTVLRWQNRDRVPHYVKMELVRRLAELEEKPVAA